jgi:hypothetical protein
VNSFAAEPEASSLQSLLRALRPIVGVSTGGSGTPSLERQVDRSEPPRIADCVPLEPSGARALAASATPQVSAFLDGVQRSQLVAHIGVAPIIVAQVAAAVRERADRSLRSWGAPRLQRIVLCPRRHLDEALWERLSATGWPLLDTSDESDAGGKGADDQVALHPHALRARAMELVAQSRETLERQLAASWCASETRWLWIDGGIAGNLAVSAESPAFGVVKSHNTLYGDAAAIRATLALREGERSPSFLVGHRARRAVASWYLRLHAATSADPLFGLVRVEIAPPPELLDAAPYSTAEHHAFFARVDQLSQGILHERAPISLPDGRWSTLTYGVYACEQYLQALLGS